MPYQPTRQFAIVTQPAKKPNHPTENVAFFAADGTALIVGTPDTGATVKMTGYVPHAVGAVAAVDTANVAVAKLEARIIALETT